MGFREHPAALAVHSAAFPERNRLPSGDPRDLRVAASPFVALLIVSGATLAGEATTRAPAPRVESFSPQGVMRGVRQVAAHFSEPMVALGDPRSIADPFEIDCPIEGTSRWADGRSWVYTFKKDLPAGLLYKGECPRVGRRRLRPAA